MRSSPLLVIKKRIHQITLVERGTSIFWQVSGLGMVTKICLINRYQASKDDWYQSDALMPKPRCGITGAGTQFRRPMLIQIQ